MIHSLNDNQLQMSNGNVITFNDEQYNGILLIREWLGNNEKFFTLSGYAGTGKSTIIKKILDSYRYKVAVTAPTHKAKKVISRTTGIEGKTLHSLLGLRPDVNLDDFDPNNPEFNPIAIPMINSYRLVIIDEASMINLELFEMIKDLTINKRIKVLFMGDSAQIPPVGEKESAVFFDESIKLYQLTKIERQNDSNPLTFIYDSIRNNLDCEYDCFNKSTSLNEHEEGVIFTNDKLFFRNSILEKYNSIEFKKDSDYCKVIAWTNKVVMESNKVIRMGLFGHSCEDKILIVGDLLMGYRSIMDEKGISNLIENSADYVVTSISEKFENDYCVNGYEVILRESDGSGVYSFRTLFIVDTKDHNNLHVYASVHDTLKNQAKENKKLWKLYYKFRRENVIMETIDKHRNGESRKSGEIIIKDLDYGYCITAHKSQGSTYAHCFILETDIDRNCVVRERNKIKYVSLTRPTKTATVLIN